MKTPIVLLLDFKTGLTGFINNLSMRTKLAFCFIIIFIVLISSVGFISYTKSSDTINRQSLIYSDTLLKQIADRIEKLKSDTMRLSIPIMIDPSIQSNDFDKLDNIGFMQRKKYIESEFNNIISINKNICSIYICTESGNIFSPIYTSSKDEMNFKDYSVYKENMDEVSVPVWTGVHENEFNLDQNRYVLTFSRPLYDNDKFRSFGSLIVNISAQVLEDICKIPESNINYNIFIIDKNGNTVFNSLGKTGSETVQRDYIHTILEGNKPGNSIMFKNLGVSYLVRYIYSKDGEWTYIAELPVDYINENSSSVKRYIFSILLLSIIVSIVAAYLISSYFSNPFRKMIKIMKVIGKGNFDVRIGIDNNSEIGLLSQNFDYMISEIKNLILKLEQEHELKRKEELNTLQAQITPHFLYNSLNAIKGMARIQKVSGIEEFTSSLIELLQISISKNTVYIKVGEEIELVKKYLLLQKYRYGNRFRVMYECNDDVMNYMTVKMVLQPLVENALFHGIEAGSGNGIIKIRAYLENDAIIMEVEDNGIGMDCEQIQKVFEQERGNNRNFSGIGIKNVNERVKMYFGEKYGLSFESEPGVYTKAIITIPKVSESEVKQDV